MSAPTVTIIGAGIAGLSAAHELAERGFAVTILERAGPPDAPSCTVGGMAASQYGTVPATPGRADMVFTTPVGPTQLRLEMARGAAHFDGPGVAQLRAFVEAVRTADPTLPWPLRITGLATPGEDGADGAGLALLRAQAAAEVLAASGIAPAQLRLGARVEPIHIVPLRDGAHGPEAAPGGGVALQLERPVLPGEHGFRFFPAFYRHLDDTMGRTPILDERGRPTGQTALDQLIPTKAVAIETQTPGRRMVLDRTGDRSLQGLLRLVKGLTQELGLSGVDLLRYQLKLFRYASACPQRRATYARQTWWDWVEGDRFGPQMQAHLQNLPRALVSMRPTAIDARSHGTIGLQLYLDQLRAEGRADRTLNGPTSEAWLVPWRRYLQHIGVVFERAQVSSLSVSGQRIQIHLDQGPPPPPADYTVLATDVGTAQRLAHTLAPCPQPSDRDLQALRQWSLNPTGQAPTPTDPLQTMTGLQFYLPGRHHLVCGHVYFEDSAWAVSAIAQSQFWAPAQGPRPPWGTVISVDICDWSTPGQFAAAGRTAWQCTRREIAEEVWAQMVHSLPRDTRLPRPLYVHFDQNIVCAGPAEDPGAGVPVDNQTPFLINPVGDRPRRPGAPGDHALAHGSLVLAGTYTQTHTRITCMEAANESARHAVNAILQDWEARLGHRWADPCPTWDPEEHELPELDALKALDAELLAEGLPHLADILDLDALADGVGSHDPLGPLRHVLGDESAAGLHRMIQDALGRLGGSAVAEHWAASAPP